MKHEVCLKLDELPLLCFAGQVKAEETFVHADRVLEEHVFLYIIQGEMEVVEDHRVYTVREGEFVFLKAGIHHWGKTEVKAGTEWFYAHFILSNRLDGYTAYNRTVSFVKEHNFRQEDYRYYLSLPKYAALPYHGQLNRRIRDFLLVYNSSDPLRISHMNAVFFELLVDVYQTSAAKSGETKQDVLVRKLIVFLEKNNVFPLSSGEISEHMRLSYKYLCAIFKRKTGLSINSYHTRIRVNEAARLMREMHLNVSEASYAVGYRDPLYFSSVFKRVLGVPPSEYLR